MKKRNHFIDLLKGVCIIFVIFTHSGWTDSQTLKLLFPFWIDMAVPIFMLISGYVYTKSFNKNEIETLDSAYNKNYLVKHIIRYTVPYLVMYFIEIGLKVFLDLKKRTSLSLFIKNSIGILLQGGMGPGSYYYPEMIQIVFLFPIIYVIVKKYKFFGVLIITFINFFLEVLKIPYYVNEELYRLLLFRYFMLLAFGSWFALKKMNSKFLFVSILGLLFILLFRYSNYKPYIFKWWTGTNMFTVLFIVPIFGFFVEKNLSFAPLEMVGKASYNIFLTQMVYFISLDGFIKKYINNIFVMSLINIFICVIVGILFYEIEFRITKRITNKILGRINLPVRDCSTCEAVPANTECLETSASRS